MHVGLDRLGRPALEVVIPECEQESLVAAAHDGMLHLGVHRTVDALRAAGVWWPGIRKSVRKYVLNCPTCAFNKVGPHHGAMQQPPNGCEPWAVVAVDIVDLETTASGNRKAVVFADRFGRGVRCYPCKVDVDSKQFLNIVAFNLIPDVGMPRILLSDRGSNIISALCREFYEAFGIDHRPGDSHMHHAAALCERFNHTLREMARAAYFDHECQWDLFLPYLVMFYNASLSEVTGFSPYFLEHGREPSLPWHD